MSHAMLPTPGHRAWFAWQCLPRDDWGTPPMWSKLEKEHRLANAAMRKLIWDMLKRPGPEQLRKYAAALGVTPEWLWYGEGAGPVAMWPVPPRPLPPAPVARKKKPSSRPPGNSKLKLAK